MEVSEKIKIYFIFSHQANFILCLRTLAVKRRHRQQRRRIVMQKVNTIYIQKELRFNVVMGTLRRVINRRAFPRSHCIDDRERTGEMIIITPPSASNLDFIARALY